ncbi:MAG TPA: metallophosphoesterase family protein [Chloroflexia bacterium]|nr:metallophosphoesterase family protein [Chloroflexia bacterium]
MATQLIGVISDTHGLLRPEAEAALAGSQLIIHAGDIGKPQILEQLQKIGPVIAVRGNNDKGAWAEALPHTAEVAVEACRILVIHDLKELKGEYSGYQVIISGHSHKPALRRQDGVMLLNPGGAGPRRFKLPLGVALLEINRSEVSARLIELSV